MAHFLKTSNPASRRGSFVFLQVAVHMLLGCFLAVTAQAGVAPLGAAKPVQPLRNTEIASGIALIGPTRNFRLDMAR